MSWSRTWSVNWGLSGVFAAGWLELGVLVVSAGLGSEPLWLATLVGWIWAILGAGVGTLVAWGRFRASGESRSALPLPMVGAGVALAPVWALGPVAALVRVLGAATVVGSACPEQATKVARAVSMTAILTRVFMVGVYLLDLVSFLGVKCKT